MNCTTTAPTSAVRVPPWPSAAHANRHPRAWRAVLLAAALAPAAWAADATFFLQPTDSTVVAGHLICFDVATDLTPSNGDDSYQWYRNGVPIIGANEREYRFTAQSADNGARYQVVAQGHLKIGYTPAGPTASASATLTVLPAGSALPPQITAPQGDTMWYTVASRAATFLAVGNDLQWQYRYNTDTQWPYPFGDGCQAVQIAINPPTGATTVSVRVTDDAGAVALRTWKLATNQAPVIVTAPKAVPNPMIYPGPVTLRVSASDPDGDPLTYTWRVASPGVFPTFVPNGTGASAVCTATAFPLANADYTILVTVSDGKGAIIEAPVPVTVKLPAGLDPRADANGDGMVNALDLGIVVDSFGQP